MVLVAYPYHLVRALSNNITAPTDSKNPTANNAGLIVPSSVAATMLMISPPTNIAMPQVASKYLLFGYLTHRLTNA